MSTVAWDGKTLAADRQSTQGDLAGVCNKIYQLATGELVAWVGMRCAGEVMMRWYTEGADLKAYPSFQSNNDLNCHFIVISVDGTAHEYSQHPVAMLRSQKPWAWGSGRDFALGAMAMGANATQAVKVASQFDINTGMGVDYFDVT